MSRSKRKTGTRPATIIARRNRQAKTFRLTARLRRLGIALVVLPAMLWAGGWLVTSGTIQRAGDEAAQGFYRISASHGFIVRDVLVEGRENADPAVLLGLLNVDRGDAIFAFDPAAARTQLLRESWIRSARVERRLPDLIYVAIEERRPFALWQHQGKLRLIDPEGVTITDAAADMARFSNLPLVVGDGAPQAAADLFGLVNAEPVVAQRLEAAIYVGQRRWDLKMKNNVVVRLPEGDLALAMRRLAGAQEADGLLDKEIESIDLREDGRIVVRTRPGAVQDYKASFKTGSAI